MGWFVGNETLIFQAAADGNLEKVEILLKRNPKLVNLRDRHSKTPLHEASTVEIAQLLIRYGADVNARGWMGSTPLHEMTSKDRLFTLSLMRKY
jgi:ankyrin repeat protein